MEYLIHNLGPRLGLSGELDVRDNGVGGVTIPGSSVARSTDGTSVITLSGGRMVFWAVSVSTEQVGAGTNVQVSVTQVGDNWLQRRTAGSQLQAYVNGVISAISTDLA